MDLNLKVVCSFATPECNYPQSTTGFFQDCFVKFHDISAHTAKPDRSLKTAVPVWKARYTPFGDGLATVIVPQVSSDGVQMVVRW